MLAAGAVGGGVPAEVVAALGVSNFFASSLLTCSSAFFIFSISILVFLVDEKSDLDFRASITLSEMQVSKNKIAPKAKPTPVKTKPEAKIQNKKVSVAPKKSAAITPEPKAILSSSNKNKPVVNKKMSTKTIKKTNKSNIENFAPYHEQKNEDYMNVPQLEHFKAMLHAWKKELMEEVDRTVHHMQDEAANFPDVSDRATQEEEFSLELRTRDRERKLIKKIDEALEKIKHQEYGYCDACGVEIGVRRLEARPTATLCIDCKTLDEIKEKQIHG